MFRSLALAGALAAGLTTTAAAQSVHIDTPFFGFSVGEPYYYDYGPRTYVYPGPRYGVRPYAYDRGYRWRRPHAYRGGGGRADKTIYSYGGYGRGDAYRNETGISNSGT